VSDERNDARGGAGDRATSGARPEGQRSARSGSPVSPREDEKFFELSAFWRVQALWPVTVCGLIGLSALGAGAVSMAFTQRNPFARAALAVAALMTAFGLWDFRSRKGKLGGGAVLVLALWVLSIVGGLLLARTGGS
jgi:hypothetical protein